MIGKVIKNRYRIVDEIGPGSLATAYLARDIARNRIVVLKIVHPEWTAEGEFLRRFQREAGLLELQSAAQAAKVYDCGEEDGLVFIVSEYVQGRALSSLLGEEGPLPINRALEIANQIALCLVDAHSKSIVHRDLRPANILITAEGAVKITDFGIARGARLDELMAEGKLGTPHYLSPEQAAGETIDVRSDLYSLGVILFEMLSGKTPYDAPSAPEIVRAHLREPIPSLRQLDRRIPQELSDLVTKCLAKRPEERYQSAAAFLEAIDAILRSAARRQVSTDVDLEIELVGQTLGTYRVIEQIGRGGMATVYKAYEPALDRYVAIKVLPQYFAHDPDFAARFDREAKAVASLNHPNILPIYSYGQEGGLSYIVMRYVEAGTLKDLLEQSLDLQAAADIVGQVGRALDYAHRQGVVHRDIKPTNVLMAEGKWALLTDFGLARMTESSVQLTKSGVGVGTPAYMSPEQGQGLRVDARSDVYSLGVVLYEMVTGRVPYEAETPMAVVLKHITAPLPLPRSVNPDLPEAVERVILKAMAKSPEDRCQTAGEMVEALERAVAETPMAAWPPEMEVLPVEETAPAIAPELTRPPTEEPAPLEAAVGAESAGQISVPARRKLPWWAFVAGGAVLLALVGSILLATGVIPPSRQPTPVSLAAPAKGQIASVRFDNGEWQLYVHDPASGVERLLTAISGFSAVGDPTWSPDGQRILLSADRGSGRNDLYAVRIDGSELSPLVVDSQSNLIDASWSPDGQWIAMHANCTLRTVRADGSGATVLHDPNQMQRCVNWPVWSPDGQSVAFTETSWERAAGPRQVQVIRRDGSRRTTLVSIEEQDWGEGRVAWSPDGRQIAYAGSADKAEQWYLIDADGSGEPQPITQSPLSWFPSFWPQWSGEAVTVAVVPTATPTTESVTSTATPTAEPVMPTSRPTATAEPVPPIPLTLPEKGSIVEPCEYEIPPQICVRNARTEQIAQMTEDLEFEQIGWSISWSPDGQQVVFSAGTDPEVTGQYDHKLYIINADGSGLRQLTRGDVNDVDVSWSPDGEWIAFHRNCGLWTIRPDGSDRRRLLEGSDEFCASLIVWSPDSQKIAFWNTHGNAPALELWVIDREGRDPRVVHSLERPVDWRHAVWTPDGAQIAYWYGKESEERAFLINPDGSGEPQAMGGDTELFRSWLPNHWPPWGGMTERPAGVPALPPAMGADRTMYDDFDNPANEGSYERGLWILAAEEEQVAQQDGVMTFRQQGQPRQGAELTSVEYHKIPLDRPIFFEARLMLSPEANAGDVHLDLRTELAPDETWYANCNIGKQEGKAWASCFNETIRHGQGDVSFSSEGKPVQFGDWHVLRMEVDPATMTFRYYIDGQFVGSHAPADADRLRKAEFTLSIGTYAPSAAALTGYVDDVRVGPLVPDDPWGLFAFPPGSTVSIGLVADFSGDVDWLGPLNEYAVQMAIEDRGPLKGFPVSALVVDGGCQDELGAAAAQTLIADPSVVGVVGHTCSTSCRAGIPLYEDAHLAMISPSCTGPDLSAQGYQVFNRVIIRDDQGGGERNEQIVNTEIYQDFALQYQRRFGRSLDSVDLGVVAAYAYDAVSILIEAIERTAIVDASGSLIVGRQALVNAVRATPGYRGITGMIRFDDRGDRVP